MARIDLIQLRRDTSANWTSVNPTLEVGEAGYETDTRKMKIGNGTDDWATLLYLSADATATLESAIANDPNATSVPEFQGGIEVGDGTTSNVNFEDGFTSAIISALGNGIFNFSESIAFNTKSLQLGVDPISSVSETGWNVTSNNLSLSNNDLRPNGFEAIVTVAGTHDFGAGNITFGVDDVVQKLNGVYRKKVDNNQSGAVGPQGPPGVDGQDGINGSDGADGTGVFNSNYPFANQVTFGSTQQYKWIKDYVIDIRNVTGTLYKTDETLRRLRFTYLTATQIFLEAETLDGTGYELVAFKIQGGGFGTEETWIQLDGSGANEIELELKIRPDSRTGAFSNKKNIEWSEIDPMIIKRGDIPEIEDTSQFVTSNIFTKNYRATETDLGVLSAIKDLRVIGTEDSDMEIAVTWISKNDATYGNGIGFQVKFKEVWRKYAVFSSLTDPSDADVWISCDYNNIPEGSTDHYTDSFKVDFKIDFTQVPTGINQLYITSGTLFYNLEPYYILSKDVFVEDTNDELLKLTTQYKSLNSGGYGDYNDVTGNDFTNTTLYVANHRWNKTASFCASTDTYDGTSADVGAKYWASELLCFKHNVPFTYMVRPFSKHRLSSAGNNNPFDNRDKYLAEQTGRLKHALYYMGIGEERTYTTDIPLEEIQSVVKNQTDAFMYHYKKYPSVFAYAVNIPDLWRVHTPFALANRTTVGFSGWGTYSMYGFDTVSSVVLGNRPTPAFDNYDQTHSLQMKIPTTGADDTAFDAVFDDEGLYHYFKHLYSDSDMAGTISDIGTELATRTDVYKGSFNEVIEYKYYRDLIDSITAKDYNDGLEDGVVIKMVLTDKYPSFQYAHMINTPISVFIDLAGTSLAGDDIEIQNIGLGEYGIIDLGNDEYILDLPNPHIKEGTVSFKIVETSSPNYYDFTAPTIVSQTVSSGVLTVTTNIPTKAVLYKTPGTSAANQLNPTLWKRSNTLSTTHTFNVNTGETYYCGVITAVNESILSTAIQP